MTDQPPNEPGRVPPGVWNRLITEALAIVPKQLKGLPGFIVGLFLLLTVVGVATFGLAKLIHGAPK